MGSCMGPWAKIAESVWGPIIRNITQNMRRGDIWENWSAETAERMRPQRGLIGPKHNMGPSALKFCSAGRHTVSMKPFMAMALILLVSGVCRAATLDADWARWADLKETDQQMAADYQAALKEKGYTESNLPLSRLFREFEKAISSVQAQQDKDESRLRDAINVEAGRGVIDPAKASELKSRVARCVFRAKRPPIPEQSGQFSPTFQSKPARGGAKRR